MGLCLGLAFLAKYAAAYLIPCAALMALARPGLRIGWRDAAMATFVFLDLAALNVAWNLANGAITFTHVAGDAGNASDFPDLAAFAEFFGAQFGVMGPVLFAGFLAALATRPESDGAAALRWLSVPVLVIVSVQALRAGANANWAAAAFVAATPLAVAWTAARPRLLKLSFALTGAAAIALPLAWAAPDLIRLPGGPSAFKRVTGQAALVGDVAATARGAGAEVVLASNRGVLSALVHGLRDDPALTVRAPRPAGPPGNSFQMLLPLEERPTRPTLWLTGAQPEGPPPGFAAMTPVADLTQADGFFAGRPLHAWLLTPEATE
jgi:4-amino-4-deoxy-L-arabinose transferase-like glycosyltransferase